MYLFQLKTMCCYFPCSPHTWQVSFVVCVFFSTMVERKKKKKGKCKCNYTKIVWQDPPVGKMLPTFLRMTMFQVHGVLLMLVKAVTLTTWKTEIFFHYFFCRTSVTVIQDFPTSHPNSFSFFKGSLLQEWNSCKFLWHNFLGCHCQLQC